MLSAMSLFTVIASWDTQPRAPYNPNAPRKPKKNSVSQPSTFSPPPSPSPSSSSVTPTPQSVSDLLKRNTNAQGVLTKLDATYLGCDTWLPKPPEVEKPRSVFNAAALAYIGDSIFELYARKHFFFPKSKIEEYNSHVTAVVRSEAQDAFLRKLLSDNCLSEEERDVLRWGKNIGSAKTRTKKRVGAAAYNRASSLETLDEFLRKLLSDNRLSEEERDVLRWGKNIGSAKTRTKKRVGAAAYNRASSLETLIGYLYLTDANRLEEIMQKLGFSTDSSSQVIGESRE